MKKEKGIFYTPLPIALFLTERCLLYCKKTVLNILEPSCGDGIFVHALKNQKVKYPGLFFQCDLVEIDPASLNKAKETAKDINNLTIRSFNTDFLLFQQMKQQRYDIIIGNPPYIKREWLSTEQQGFIREIHNQVGLSSENIRNIWPAFVLACSQLLKEDGIMAFVLPNELLQVKFAEEVRQYITKVFSRIEVVLFNSFVFEKIEQDTILLICYMYHKQPGIFFSYNHNTNSIQKEIITFKRTKITQTGKWIASILNNEESSLLKKIETAFPPLSYYCDTSPGVVTAANDYFIIDQETVKRYELHDFVIPILLKGAYVNGNVVFLQKDFNALKEAGYPCYLITITENNKRDFELKQKEYIELGLAQEIEKRYKCRNRSVWYQIPGTWESMAIFFKRTHKYPKLIKNPSKILVTDTGYRIKLKNKNKHDLDSFIYSFYNSATLVFCELYGRYYGGGVLELTPREFKKLPLPYTNITRKEFKEFTQDFQNKSCISEILEKNDKIILGNYLNFSKNEISILHGIRAKLLHRRLKK